jgi:putative hydrolase of the HAD superfamily
VFEDPRSWALFPETHAVLTKLREEGFELGVVSNFDSRLFPVMRGLGIEGLFDTVTISSLAQAAKPASKIFEIALEKHSMDPGEAMHVGDSVRDDMEGATKAGLTGVLLDRTGRVQVSGGHVIRTLEELLPLALASKE